MFQMSQIEIWKTFDNRLKYKSCPNILNPRYFFVKILKQIISAFILEHLTNIILNRVNVSKYKLLRILTLIRMLMTKDVPNVFERIVEVDETYLGCQMKNKRQKDRVRYGKSRREFGTIKQLVF